MKKTLIVFLLMLCSVLVQLIPFLPWWSFLLVIFFLGVIIPFKSWKVSPFTSGFFAGFAVWTGATFFFETIYGGEIIDKMGKMFYINYCLLYIIIGIMGGGITGLSVYSGFLLKLGKKTLFLESD